MTTRVIGPVFSVLFSVLLLVNVASHAVASGHNPAFREITQTLQFDDLRSSPETGQLLKL